MNSTDAMTIAAQMDDNFGHTFEMASGINGLAVEKDDFATYTVSPYTVPWMNAILQSNGSVPNVNERVKNFLHSSKVAMTWRLGPRTQGNSQLKAALELAGAKRSSWEEPGMHLQVERFVKSEPLPELKISEVVDAHTVNDWLAPFCEAFEIPDDVREHFRTYGVERLPKNANEQWFVGHVDGEIACCSQYVSACGVNMIYSIGTLKPFRSRGLARRMVEHTITAALKHAELPVCLYASEMGLKLYQSIGFDTAYTRTDYIYQPQMESLLQ